MNWDKYENFSASEFQCSCCKTDGMDELFMDKLQAIRTRLKVPMKITSGYRCPDYDWKIGGKGNHTTGRAVDIQVPLDKVHDLVRLAAPSMTGIGVKMKGPQGGRFIHLDDLVNDNRPRVWSY